MRRRPRWPGCPTAGRSSSSAPEARTAAEKAREKAKDDVYAFDEDYKQRHLWRVELPAAPSAGAASRPSAGHVSRVTGGDFSVGAFEIARDGRRIVHQRLPDPAVRLERSR